MKFIDLFAGIGGFRRGMEMAGHTCVGFCEFDQYAVMSYTMMHLATKEQREYIKNLPAPPKKDGEPNLRKRQQEILKEGYRNGEWYSNDIRTVDAGSIPRADCWCFGAPCQDFSIAGKRAGLDGDRSSLVREVFRILGEIREKDRPEWLIYENVKGMLSSNRGFDFLEILLAMDELGYDVEWQLFNSKDWGVPQNRERVYTVGHLRRCGTRKILPLTGADGENSISVNCININDKHGHERKQQDRIYDSGGIMTALNSQLGGRHNVALPCFVDMNYGAGIKQTETARYLQSRYNKGICNHKAETSGIAIPFTDDIIPRENNYNQRKTVHSVNGLSRTLVSSSHSGNEPKIAIPVITPERAKKRQNGRRFKDNGEPMFTLTGQDRHGVGLNPLGGIYTNASPEYQRGISDKYCRSLKANKSDSGIALKAKDATEQGHSIAHEGDAIDLKAYCSSTRRGTVKKQIAGALDHDCNQGIFVQVSDELTAYAIWYEKYQCYIAIRKLTPKECFRLQGWKDIYFERAAAVNSDSQLYKQAGNGVTVNVVYEIARRINEISFYKR